MYIYIYIYNIPTKIIPTKIRWRTLSGTFPMGLRIPALNIRIMLESNSLLKSRVLVWRLTVMLNVFVYVFEMLESYPDASVHSVLKLWKTQKTCERNRKAPLPRKLWKRLPKRRSKIAKAWNAEKKSFRNMEQLKHGLRHIYVCVYVHMCMCVYIYIYTHGISYLLIDM